jgi:hypothetical protein
MRQSAILLPLRWERVGVRDEVSEKQLLLFFLFLEHAQATPAEFCLKIAERLPKETK